MYRVKNGKCGEKAGKYLADSKLGLRSSRSIGHHYLNVWRKNKVAKSGKGISHLQTKIGDTNLRTVSQ